MRRKLVKINVAVDSIIYAPLYAFIQKNSIDLKSKFRFQISPTPDPPELEETHDLSGLAPITKDPTFSPVLDPTTFNKNENLWFGVGDPLRIRRLVLSGGNIGINDYSFVGTLVSKPALWLIIEQRCASMRTKVSNYNYVGCHAPGMTGYYLSELVFKRQCNNPLAPSYRAGDEIEHWKEVLNTDLKRRHHNNNNNDPVWLAVVSTEIDEAIFIRHEKISQNNPSPYFLCEVFTQVPEDFLFTAIVARRYSEQDQQQIVTEAEKVLCSGVSEMIGNLGSDRGRNEVANFLYDFYDSRPTFILPGISKWGKKSKINDIKQILTLLQMKEIYPQKLRAPTTAKEQTDKILELCIDSEIFASGYTRQSRTNKVAEYLDLLKTDQWNGAVLWV